MKGERTIIKIPFRYGGIDHDYSMTSDECAEKFPFMAKCYACGGKMKGARLITGKELKTHTYPYAAFYRITKGKNKGLNHFKLLCRVCAYEYGLGVIEMDGNTYMSEEEFKESKYKKAIGYEVKRDGEDI